MSYEKALETVDFLLSVIEEANQPAPKDESSKTAPATSNEELKEEYFESVEDDGVKVGQTVKVTQSLARLEQCWEEAELGANDEKNMYLGVVGKVMECEEDDDTVMLRWQNLDTYWIPIKACVPSNGAKETLPNGMISHLG
mmetsp:Transcript_8177/g.12653  ORF Transcript_8177/g.12653 Transcript_8177/m.12653 type:complete len:141 (+) Transcript_8177:133-555(+)|eukprot:CAMPEP_0202691192 /NCGR_PEP_ID=MMETSP1385-20130828/5977_1 /ASSEMBLY_ACC=CAM_ASM_000861 /TAXON_ID=933848 /ORGANISM="Elphidium margaritaceum" /LENGTH=140 /DNA_ID=CAMNT_0049346559 /DNA_START=96 /DNA_END=518 /DNA_ORIENTATION=-